MPNVRVSFISDLVIAPSLGARAVPSLTAVNNINGAAHSNTATIGGATLTRPRPQPIAGTPPPEPNEKFDAKIIQQTCSLFGIDLVSFPECVKIFLGGIFAFLDLKLHFQERPPPVPPSRPYTVTGNKKFGYPQTRIMKMPYPGIIVPMIEFCWWGRPFNSPLGDFCFISEDASNETDTTLMKGDTVVVIGASNKRGHLIVEHSNHNLIHVPFQFLEFQPSAYTIQ